MAFTEFCCRSGGSNLNAGTRTGSSTEPGTSADLTYASGDWVNSTGVFTVASGDPVADGVAVNDYASVYPNGSSTAVWIGRVSARTSTTITVNSGVGAKPSNGTGDRTLRIGGAWAGPSGTDTFPFGFATDSLRNASSQTTRVNFKNDQTYSISAQIINSAAGIQWWGYGSTYGDEGKAVFDGGDPATSFQLFDLTGSTVFADFELRENGKAGTGTAGAIRITGSGVGLRLRTHAIRGFGMSGNGSASFRECEAYDCNNANAANSGGLITAFAHECVSYDNVGSNNAGFVGMMELSHCRAWDNQIGVNQSSNFLRMIGCDIYNNTSHGLSIGAVPAIVQNCNFVKNGGYGISVSASATYAMLLNNAFGAGTQANTSGTTSNNGKDQEFGSINYASDVTPWNDPTTDDYAITLEAAKGTGRSNLQVGGVGYPDIGAAQHQDSGGGGAFAVIGRNSPTIRGKF